jgi:hypothetical protein
MATVPLSGTNISFLTSIQFNNDYKHTRWFDTLNDQSNWFSIQTAVHTELQANFQRIEGRHFVRVNKSIDDLWNVNYLTFHNASFQKTFYAFVTKIEYVQKGTCNVYFEIDVLQTWMFEMNFKPSFVVREHCQLWNADGSPVINTQDEGLHYGTDYKVASVDHYRVYDDLYFLVVVSKKTLQSPSVYQWSVNGLPQHLCFYVHPFKLDGSVPASNVTLTPYVGDVITNIYTNTADVNNVVSMYVTDMLPDNPFYDGTTITFDTNKYASVAIGSANTLMCQNVSYSSWIKDMGNKYDGFTPNTEPKLDMYPYRVTVITDFKGNQIELKNEYIDSPDLILDIRGSLGVSNKTVYSVKDYLNGQLNDDGVKEKISMEHALIDNNPNDIPVLVDMLAAYIQGNRNSIQLQKDKIEFNADMGIGNGLIAGIASIMAGSPVGALSSGTSIIKSGGDAMLQSQALQAKQKDISNVPPSIAKMGSNSYFDFGNGYTGVWIIKKEITPEYRKRLTDYFNMYGYKKNEVKIPNFHTRQNWNYVQTTSCIIRGNFNNNDLDELKAVFDNGITLWHTDDIGNYALSNGVIANG